MKIIILFMALVSAVYAINYHGCALAPDTMHGWVVCFDTVLILQTTNGGASWIPQQVPPDTIGRRLWDITCYGDTLAWITGLHLLHTAEILHTNDGGNYWYRQEAGFSKYGTRIEFYNQDIGWAVGGLGQLARTTNGGVYWERVNTEWFEAEYYGVSFVNQWDGWICAGWPDSIATGQGYIVATNDGGIIWDTLDGHHASGYEDFFDLHFFNVNEGIVVGGYDSTYVPIVWKTTNGGSTWNPINLPGNVHYLRAVDFVELEGWAVGKSGTIIHTTDGGDTWTTQTSPADSTLFDVDFIDHQNGLACGYGHILRTTNGGQTWTSVGVEELESEVPAQITLNVRPNPFSIVATISYGNVPSAKRMELKIYDVGGRLVRSFDPVSGIEYQVAHVLWDGSDRQGKRVPAGVYFVELSSSDQTIKQKIVMLE